MYIFLLMLKGVGALQELKYVAQRQPKRVLTENELLALRPFVKLERARLIDEHLRSYDVHEVFGDFEKLLIRGRGVPQTEYFFSGIRVALPYDAESYMDEKVMAEVAVARHCVIPLSTDRGFELVDSAWRFLESQLRENRASDQATYPRDFSALARVEDVCRRRETVAEVRMLKWWDRVWLFPLLSFVAAHSIGAGHDLATANDVFYVLFGSAALIGAFFFYVMNMRLVRPKQEVREIKGWLFEIPGATPFGDPHGPRFHLGTEVVLNFPKHWREHAKKLVGKRVQLSVSARGGRVVAIKDVIALESEELIFPFRPWGGHLSALVIGLWLAWGGSSGFVWRQSGVNLIWACVAALGCAVSVIALARLIRALKFNKERTRRLSERLKSRLEIEGLESGEDTCPLRID